jgi:hypothetical protein
MSARETSAAVDAAAPPQEPVPAGPPPGRASLVRDNRVTLVAGAVAVALAAVVWFVLPHEREVGSVGELLFKLTPYAAAAVAIAWLDVAWAQRLRLHLVAPPLMFLVFFCFFVPKIFYYSGRDFTALYYHVLVLVPFVILALVLSFRLGGGSTGAVLRLAGAMILLQLSGLEDLAFLVVNDHSGDPRFASIPDVWTWASHMNVFFGRPVTRNEAYAFIAVHVVLALLVLFLPGRAVRSVLRRR